MNARTFFTELKRRRVYSVAVAYLVVTWLLIQVATQVFPFFSIPNWVVRLVVLLAIIGFPIAVVCAWAFELTPEGIKLEGNVDHKIYRAGALQLSGNLEAASKVLAAVPPELDPQGAVSLQRCYLAMAMRQPEAALAVLSKAPAWLNTATDGLMMPATLWRGQALAARNENDAARSAFLEAKQAMEEKRRAAGESAGTESYLSLAYAGLGEKDAALQAGRRATELLPMSQDVLSGAWYLYQLAQIEAQFGETDSAIKHIEQLLAVPAGFYVSDPSLRTDPAWDSLRNDPRFQKLMSQYEGKAGERKP
jgi:tetratricopeptide (TPR) repeat protein